MFTDNMLEFVTFEIGALHTFVDIGLRNQMLLTYMVEYFLTSYTLKGNIHLQTSNLKMWEIWWLGWKWLITLQIRIVLVETWMIPFILMQKVIMRKDEIFQKLAYHYRSYSWKKMRKNILFFALGIHWKRIIFQVIQNVSLFQNW